MRKLNAILIFCLAAAATFGLVGCSLVGGGESSVVNESVAETEITVTFDPCNEDYEGLKTNKPLPQTLEKGELLKEPTLRAIQNDNNYAFGGWYLSKDYADKWDFETDTVETSITLYARWVSSFEVNYYLTDGEMTELKRTAYVAQNSTITEEPNVAFGYELLGYYKDVGLTEEFDFTAPITANTNVYVKRSPYIFMDGKFIVQQFKGVASGAGENGATFGGMKYVEDGEGGYVDVNFGYCPTALDPHIILETMPLVITKSQKIEITFKIPEDSGALNALVVYGTSLYGNKSIAVFQGATEKISDHISLGQVSKGEWITATFDLDEDLYGGASIWANSTYLRLLRIQLQYANVSVDENDTNSLYIKSIKGVADDTYVGTDDTFAEGFLESASEGVLSGVVSTVETGFSFPADREQVSATVVNGASYNKEDGLLVYMPYRTEYNEVTIRTPSEEIIDMDKNKGMKVTLKNLGYIEFLEMQLETDEGLNSKVVVNMPAQMTEFETINIDLSHLKSCSGNLKKIKIAANSLGIDNAYIIQSIEFVEYLAGTVVGFDFTGVEDTETLTSSYNGTYQMLGFDVKASGAAFEKSYTRFAINGYDAMTLVYANPEGGISKVTVTLTVDGVDSVYEYAVEAGTLEMKLSLPITAWGNVTNMEVAFEGVGVIYLSGLVLSFEKGLDFTTGELMETYIKDATWVKGMHDSTEAAARIYLDQAPAMFYQADAGFDNIAVGDDGKMYLVYQNRADHNDVLTLLLYGTDSETGKINYSNSKVYYAESIQYMNEGEWAVAVFDISDFAWEYINLIKIQDVGTDPAELYVRSIIFA